MPAARRTTRSSRQTGDAVVDELAKLVSELIRENRRLKTQVGRLSSAGGDTVGVATRGLNAMRRRIENALGGSSRGRRSQTARTGRSAAVRTRKPVSPEVREKRLAALAKAREARAAKRAAAQG